MRFDYDLFVIGAGPGGLAASEQASAYGTRVAIAEQDLIGGTCVIRGCIPEKLMSFAAEFGNNPRTVSYEYVPLTVSSHPEAATVSLSEAQAIEKLGSSVQCYRSKFRPTLVKRK